MEASLAHCSPSPSMNNSVWIMEEKPSLFFFTNMHSVKEVNGTHGIIYMFSDI
jgi:hypothetical protein